MEKGLRRLFICLTILSLIALGTACGSKPADDDGKEAAASKTADEPSEERARPTGENTEIPPHDNSTAASAHDALQTAAVSQGLFVGEVPKGFPLDFLPLFPNGTIDRSSIRGREATLLQVVPASKDKVLAYYRNFYTDLGWTANDPITAADRALVYFSGNGAQVDMTLMDREDGKTLVALSLY